MAKMLDNTFAVVTGGASGIGRAVAMRFAAEGSHVMVLDRDLEAAQATVLEIVANGGRALAQKVDVSDAVAVGASLRALERVDILVNSAGVSSIGTIEGASVDEMDRLYAINVKGVFNTMKAVVPLMKAQGSGAILNLSSIVAKVGIAERFAYSMSKGAVLAMTRSVAKDFVRCGIRCNCLSPGRIHTPFVDRYLEDHYPDTKADVFRSLSQYQPIGRMGKPEEVAAMATFLCSDQALFVTGADYDIDGGIMGVR